MEKLFAKSGPEWTSLQAHLLHVQLASIRFARHLTMDEKIASQGAILHDIGKAHPAFQKQLKGEKPKKTFRHEIASLFFLSLFDKTYHSQLIEMVIGHHKSVKYDSGEKGLLDLIQNDDIEDFHLGDWEAWSEKALVILSDFEISTRKISREEAQENLDAVISYSKKAVRTQEYSEWRGLLMGADHFASAVIVETESKLQKTFLRPKLIFFERQHHLYPLSTKNANSEKPHSLVVACTGAGKTDFLFRRCNGRVFYTLPFQASINAMYKRLSHDLEKDNPNLDIRVLHASSSVVKRNKEEEETVLQSLFGSAIKVLTPHQLAAIAFGIKGYEAILLDIKGCDVILDEIHTYTGVSQAIVLKLVEILNKLNCRVHIGTATMPTALYEKIKALLGSENVLETQLSTEELNTYDRHTVHKIESWEMTWDVAKEAINNKQKVLMVCNRVDRAQSVYQQVKKEFPKTDKLLLHSRFKRGDRNKKEKQLIGLGNDGKELFQFNTSQDACIVVSTQIVEVSLDISFDVMITDCSPLDALIQRFGRINRKRTQETIGNYKPVYVIAPPEDKKDALPYDKEVLERTYNILPNGEVLHEIDLQAKIDQVFPEIDFLDIEEHSIFKANGNFSLDKLTHKSKSYLLNLLDIDSVSCITEADEDNYRMGKYEDRLNLEIPVRYWSVKHMRQLLKVGNQPFVVPDAAYDPDLGLDLAKVKEQNLDVNYQIL